MVVTMWRAVRLGYRAFLLERRDHEVWMHDSHAAYSRNGNPPGRSSSQIDLSVHVQRPIEDVPLGVDVTVAAPAACIG